MLFIQFLNHTNVNNILFLDGKFGLSEFDRFRKKWAASGGNNSDSNTNIRRGSLDRRTNYSTATNSGALNTSTNVADNRYSWSSDEFITDAFRPVTLTVNGFFKQVYNILLIKIILNSLY